MPFRRLTATDTAKRSFTAVFPALQHDGIPPGAGANEDGPAVGGVLPDRGRFR
jgi:hypothetical protein